MSKLKEAFESLKLDWTSLAIILEGGGGQSYEGFEISPIDFLQYAKEDLKDDPDDERNMINSLSNSKRAIDCQIDEMFMRIGVNYTKLPKSLETYTNLFVFKTDLAYKLRVVSALNLAPVNLLSKYRNLRNKLEHFYKLPSTENVHDAIDIADLFIRCIEGKLDKLDTEFYITDKKNQIDDSDSHEAYKNGISFMFEIGRFYYWVNLNENKSERQELLPDDPLYFAMLRIMYSLGEFYTLVEAMEKISTLIGNPIPVKDINLSSY